MYYERISQAHDEEEEVNTKLAYDEGRSHSTYPIQSPKAAHAIKLDHNQIFTIILTTSLYTPLDNTSYYKPSSST